MSRAIERLLKPEWAEEFKEKGVVYIIHFMLVIGNRDNPRGMAQHYIGYTSNLIQRIAYHLSKTVSKGRLVKFANSKGIFWQVVYVTEGNKENEKRLKRQKGIAGKCPLCRDEYLRKRRERYAKNKKNKAG